MVIDCLHIIQIPYVQINWSLSWSSLEEKWSSYHFSPHRPQINCIRISSQSRPPALAHLRWTFRYSGHLTSDALSPPKQTNEYSVWMYHESLQQQYLPPRMIISHRKRTIYRPFHTHIWTDRSEYDKVTETTYELWIELNRRKLKILVLLAQPWNSLIYDFIVNPYLHQKYCVIDLLYWISSFGVEVTSSFSSDVIERQ